MKCVNCGTGYPTPEAKAELEQFAAYLREKARRKTTGEAPFRNFQEWLDARSSSDTTEPAGEAGKETR